MARTKTSDRCMAGVFDGPRNEPVADDGLRSMPSGTRFVA
jgi:hypothetical protein